MESKFKKGDKVRVVKKGKIILDNGIISNIDINNCTFEMQYSVEYFNKEKNMQYTMICVPEKNVVKIID